MAEDKSIKHLTDKVQEGNSDLKIIREKLVGDIEKKKVFEKEEKVEKKKRDDAFKGTLIGGLLEVKNSLTKGFKGLSKSLDKGFSGKFLIGAGLVAGVLAAPFIAISAFVTQLNNEFKAIRGLFTILRKKFKSIRKITNFIPKLLSNIEDGLKGVTEVFSKIGSRIRKVFKAFSGSKSFMAGFGKIGNIAKVFGSIMGKVFLPVTVVMAIWDAIKGFTQTEGNIAQKVVGALASVIDGMFGGLVRMLSKVVTWLLDLLGFDKLSAILGDTVDSILGVFSGIKDIIMGVFGGDTSMIKGGINKVFDGIVDALLFPINAVWSFIQDIFDFANIDLPDLNIAGYIKGSFGSWWEGVKTWFTNSFDFSTMQEAIASALNIAVFIPNTLMTLGGRIVSWIAGVFGFDNFKADLDVFLETFSLGDLVMGTAESIFDFFKGILDFDFMSAIKSIPGAESVLKFLGIGEESAPKKSELDKIAEEKLKLAEKIRSLEADVADDSWFETKKGRLEDIEELKKAREQMSTLESTEKSINDRAGDLISQVHMLDSGEVLSSDELDKTKANSTDVKELSARKKIEIEKLIGSRSKTEYLPTIPLNATSRLGGLDDNLGSEIATNNNLKSNQTSSVTPIVNAPNVNAPTTSSNVSVINAMLPDDNSLSPSW